MTAHDPQWSGARHWRPMCGLVLVVYAAAILICWVTNPEHAWAVGLVGGALGATGVWLVVVGIGVARGSIRLSPELLSPWGARLGRAQVRAILPLLVGVGVLLAGAAATVAWHAPFGTGYLWIGVACAALWVTLFVAGVPAALMPASFREHGPRRYWDPLPPLSVYPRPGAPALERWIDARRAGRSTTRQRPAQPRRGGDR